MRRVTFYRRIAFFSPRVSTNSTVNEQTRHTNESQNEKKKSK